MMPTSFDVRQRFKILECTQHIPAWYKHGRAPEERLPAASGGAASAKRKRGKKRGSKGKKDPDAPKKVLNAYNFYLRPVRLLSSPTRLSAAVVSRGY